MRFWLVSGDVPSSADGCPLMLLEAPAEHRRTCVISHQLDSGHSTGRKAAAKKEKIFVSPTDRKESAFDL